MLALLLECTIVEQCDVILFFLSEGSQPSEINSRLLAQYRKMYDGMEGVPIGGEVQKWQDKHCS
jgi:hypothetical protein